MKTLNDYSIKIYLLVTLIISIPIISISQGLILDKSAYKKIPEAKISTSKGEILPPFFSLVAHTPYPKNQGRVASCVGWSIANAFTIHTAYQQGNSHRGNIDNRRYSALFIYNLIKQEETCSGGASLMEGLDLLKDKGVCYYVSFPSDRPCTERPSERHFREAANHKLRAYYRSVFKKSRDKIKNTQWQIAKGNPVIVGFSAIPSRKRGYQEWFPDEQPNEQLGHAMVVVGYDDTHFTLMNSYGRHWGSKGFVKISYANYEKYAQEAFVLDYREGGKGQESKPHDATMQITMNGSIEAEMSTSNKNKDLIQQPISFQYNADNNQYSSLDSITSNNNYLHLQLSIPKGTYVYLFNVDDNNIVSPMWQMEAYHKDTTALLPPPNTTYRLSGLDNEYLGVFFSYRKLIIFDQQLQQLEANLNNYTLENAIDRTWKEALLHKKAITFQKGKVAFESNSTVNEGYVVPILLELHSARGN